ncbi:murein DD-endopeptidase MepM/ murein hydrolase activator NlpD [Anaerospora hongkongensis]|uniref:Murein DD-endopeptidase MepM/ murein hydrolase activator NlpD n=1 Tax=Anaerospora hongkongensis TaxID=244830 RepID=A0A4R1PZJ9_9FIRM|nr:M23 family metallopeptidase [Anaerospora hongkongensis]TCL38311.1 murein DD-endopeptidase MepM/ murein hydrolase activator NlpD [Anaerospora hongkongensis]
MKWSYGLPGVSGALPQLMIVAVAAGLFAGAAVILTVPAPPVSEQTKNEVSQPVREPALPQAAPAKEVRVHTVTEGETLSGIAATYDIDVETLISANPQMEDAIYPGEELTVLPGRGILHVVEAEDTFWRLANLYGVTVEQIMAANNKKSEILSLGEKIFVPGGRYRSAESASRAGAARFAWPTAGELSSPFGYRWGRAHTGIDIANDVGTPVGAARSGRVVFTGWQGGYGYTIVMEHGNEYSTLYGHLDSFAVSQGQYVQAGQTIGYMGDTGNSTGPHLHFEVRLGGIPVNPMLYLK